MKILCITHADFESPGIIESWALSKKYHFEIQRPYRGERLSSVNSFDFLIIMGGPQSPLHMNESPYLISEIDLIKNAIAQNKKIIGFCLGAQLIGEALGAKTERSPEKEVGVYPITLTEEGKKDYLFTGVPSQFPVIHWHNDMPGLTPNTVVLASSPGCPRQIVKYKKNIYGFQCHLEITHAGIETMIEAVPGDLKPSLFTQTKEELLGNDYETINHLMRTLLDRFVSE